MIPAAEQRFGNGERDAVIRRARIEAILKRQAVRADRGRLRVGLRIGLRRRAPREIGR